MIKTAYLFSGQLRDFKSIYPNLKKNVLDPTNADIYAYLWDWDGSVPKRFEDEGTIGEFVDLYKPKRVEIQTLNRKFLQNRDHILRLANKNKRSEINPENVICQYWGWSNSFCLPEERYDVYIKGRSEVTFNRPITQQELNIAKNMLMIPKGHDSLGINDIFAMGNYTHMRKYMLIYWEVFKMIEDSAVVFHPETMLKDRLKKEIEKQEIFRFDFPLFLRGKEVTLLP